MTLSLLKTPMTLVTWAKSFLHGQVKNAVLNNPVLFWKEGAGMEVTADASVLRLHEWGRQFNAYYRHFDCLLDRGMQAYGYPALDIRFLGPRTMAMMHSRGELGPGLDSHSVGLLDHSMHTQPRGGPTLYKVSELSLHMGWEQPCSCVCV